MCFFTDRVRRTARSGILLCAMLAAMLLGVYGCNYPADAGLLEEAYLLGEAYQWGQARPLIRAYLLRYPHDAGAHYLLGQAYHKVATPFLLQAEGELKLAERLVREYGAYGVFEKLMTRDEFIAAIYKERAVIYMRSFHQGTELQMPPELLKDQLEKALQFAEKGLELDPHNRSLGEIKATLDELLQNWDTPPTLFDPPEPDHGYQEEERPPARMA